MAEEPPFKKKKKPFVAGQIVDTAVLYADASSLYGAPTQPIIAGEVTTESYDSSGATKNLQVSESSHNPSVPDVSGQQQAYSSDIASQMTSSDPVSQYSAMMASYMPMYYSYGGNTQVAYSQPLAPPTVAPTLSRMNSTSVDSRPVSSSSKSARPTAANLKPIAGPKAATHAQASVVKRPLAIPQTKLAYTPEELIPPTKGSLGGRSSKQFPPALRRFVERSFSKCQNQEQKAVVEKRIRSLIQKCITDGTLGKKDWDNHPSVLDDDTSRSVSDKTKGKQDGRRDDINKDSISDNHRTSKPRSCAPETGDSQSGGERTQSPSPSRQESPCGSCEQAVDNNLSCAEKGVGDPS